MMNIKFISGLICFFSIFIFSCATFNISATDNNVRVDARKALKFESVIEKSKPSIVPIVASTVENPTPLTAPQNAVCTGAVVGDVGHILTNFHCIYKQKYLRVLYWDLDDWRSHRVDIIGTDPLADLALLRVVGKKKTVSGLKFADNFDELKTGQDVWAFGHPMGMSWTVTKGIISSTDRYARHPYIKTIQTDAAINKGNSGGPLLNMKGEIIGINALIISRISESAGVGLAIRGDIVKNSYERMLSSEHGTVDRPAIGVMISPLMTDKQRDTIVALHPKEIKKEDIPNTHGLLVRPGGNDNETFKEIPKTLKAWDTIIAVNGEPINNGIDLADEMIKYKIGDNVTLMVIRDHRFKNVIIPLKVFPVPVEKMYANDRR